MNFRKFLLANSLSFLRSLWSDAQLSRTSATPLSSALSAKLLSVRSVQGHAWDGDGDWDGDKGDGEEGTENNARQRNIQLQSSMVEK